MKHVWYRRAFEIPAAMSGQPREIADNSDGNCTGFISRGQRVRLHFGGVDYQTWVWINGQRAGSHVGGDVSFVFDITKFLHDGSNEVVVHAFDDTASGDQPTGKQTHTVSEGCVYTRTPGIWQPVAWPKDDYPFTPESCPIEIVAKGKQIPEWTMDKHGLCAVLQDSPAGSTEPTQDVTLIPMGAARLRISAFPTVSDSPSAHTWRARRQARLSSQRVALLFVRHRGRVERRA